MSDEQPPDDETDEQPSNDETDDSRSALSWITLLLAAASAVVGIVWVVRIAVVGGEDSIFFALLPPLLLIYMSLWYLRDQLGI